MGALVQFLFCKHEDLSWELAPSKSSVASTQGGEKKSPELIS